MAEYVVMPKADYVDACDAAREKTGGTEVIKSGELGEMIRGIESGGGGMPWWWQYANNAPLSAAFAGHTLTDLPDPMVFDISETRMDKLGTVFNAGYVNCETIEVYFPAIADGVYVGGIAGGGGWKPSGIKTVKVRYGGSETVLVKNAEIVYMANSPTVETIDCILDLSLYAYSFSGGFNFGEALANVRFKENTIQNYNMELSKQLALTDESLVSIANALTSGSATLTLHDTPKARCDEILGMMFSEADSETDSETGGDTTCDFFMQDEAGDTTLTEFITNVKGWTLA